MLIDGTCYADDYDSRDWLSEWVSRLYSTHVPSSGARGALGIFFFFWRHTKTGIDEQNYNKNNFIFKQWQNLLYKYKIVLWNRKMKPRYWF